METGFLYAIGASILWGLVYVIDQKILIGINPVVLVFIDSIIAALVVSPFIFFSHGSIKNVLIVTKPSLFLIILTVILATVANVFIFSGIKILGASTASIIEIMYPFFVVLFSYVFFRSSPNVYFFVGGLLIFAGCIIIIKLA